MQNHEFHEYILTKNVPKKMITPAIYLFSTFFLFYTYISLLHFWKYNHIED